MTVSRQATVGIEVLGGELSFILEVDFTPERRPVHTMNHDSPHFSDPGDAGEIHLSSGHCDGYPLWKLTDEQLDYIQDEYWQEIYDQCEDEG